MWNWIVISTSVVTVAVEVVILCRCQKLKREAEAFYRDATTFYKMSEDVWLDLEKRVKR